MKVLLALGGNAMANEDGRVRVEDQQAAAAIAMRAVAELIEAGADVVLTHGNGPQVGNLLLMNELAAADVAPMPLDWCDAQTQATIGFLLANALERSLSYWGRLKKLQPDDAEVSSAFEPVSLKVEQPKE